jgi:hypothetical protein
MSVVPVVTNTLYGTRPIVIHAHGVMRHKPAWPPIRDAVFAAPPRTLRAVPELTLITCNNGHEAMGLFEASVARLGLRAEVYGHGIDPWVNARDKPRVLAAALAAIQTEFVLYADSRDAVLLDDPRLALERLPAGCDFWLGGDRINWPALPAFRTFERALPGAAESEFKYLNGGAWLGRTAFVREVFAEAAAMPPLDDVPDSEQGILKTLFPRHVPRMQLDYRCEVFQNIGFVMADIFTVELSGTK